MSITVGTDGYCTLKDIKNQLPLRKFSGTSKPSESDVEGFITDAFYQMNDALRSAGYSVPMTDATDQATLKIINAKIVAVRIEQAIAISQRRDIGDSIAPIQDEITAFFDGLKDGSLQLSTGDNPAYTPDGQEDLLAGGDNETPDFKIDDATD